MSLLDICIIVFFLAITLVIGFRSGRKITSLTEYAIGNRNFSDFAIFCTVAATVIDGNTIVGFSGKVYEIGIVHFLASIGVPMSYIVIAIFAATRIRKFYGCVSLGDIFHKSYGQTGRFFAGAVGLVYNAFAVSIQFGAMGAIFSILTNLNYATSLLISAGILMIYTGKGGIRAVTVTDVLQFIILIVAIPILLSFALQKVGGFDLMMSSVSPKHLEFFSSKDFGRYWPLVLIFSFPSLSPSNTQRLLITKDGTQGVKAFVATAIIYVIVLLFIASLGLCATLIYPNIPKVDQVIPTLVKGLLPLGVKGICIAGMLAVLMSSADSELNAGSIIFVNDIGRLFKRLTLDDRQKLIFVRIVTVFIGIIGILVALFYQKIFEATIARRGLWMSTVLIPLYFSLFNRKVSIRGFLTSMLVGFTTLIIWDKNIKPITKIDGVFPSFIANFVVFTTFYIAGGRKKIFENVGNDSLIHTIRTERAEHEFDEEAFNGRTNTFLGIFLLAIQILPMLFIEKMLTPATSVLALINGSAAILLIFGPSFQFFYQKHYKWFRDFALFLCLPLTSIYMLFKVNQMIYFIALCMSLLVIQILNVRNQLRTFFLNAMVCISTYAIFCSSGHIFKTFGVYSWEYSYYFIGLCILTIMMFYRLLMLHTEIRMRRARYELARSVSHDLMTPLVAMRAIFRRCKLDGVDEREKAMMTDCLMDMTGIIDSILPGISCRYRQMELHALDEIVVKCIELKKFLNKRLKIRMVTAEKVLARVDALLFKRTMSNLINNCIEAIVDKQNGEIVISIGRDKFGNAQVSIKDNGCGISKKRLKTIFKRNTSFGKQYGFGIGLNEAQRVVSSWNGNIFIKSELNEGTFLQIILPPEDKDNIIIS